MYLIFDCETTGFPNPNLLSTQKGQARVCQIAAILVDREFNELDSLYTLIKPDGWVMSPGAQKAHGISIEQCEKEGIPMGEVFPKIFGLRNQADYRVAHNVEFDDTMLDIEYDCYVAKNTKESLGVLREQCAICTMDIMTDICKLPFATKRTFGKKYKWPRLQEAYQYIFKEEFQGAHDAFSDVRATSKIFKWLVEQKIVSIDNKMLAQ